MILLHASDIHFGKRHDPGAAAAFLAAAHALPSDVLVVSGDFTQRAKLREYEAARAYLDRLPERPLVVTPGNHDVPLYRFWERAFAPYRNYRAYISPDLDSVTSLPGATIVALNSSTPYTAIVNGRLRGRQLEMAANAFAAAPSDALRIVVTHHPIVTAPDFGADQLLPGAEWIARRLTAMGVEIVLSGHLHRSYLATTAHVCEVGQGVAWIAHSGTTTSTRGRASERGKNTFNRLEVGEEHMIFERFMYFADRSAFECVERRTVPRGPPHLAAGVGVVS